MDAKGENILATQLRSLAENCLDLADEARQGAEFSALEWLEAEYNDNVNERERALRLAAKAAAYKDIEQLVRSCLRHHCPEPSKQV